MAGTSTYTPIELYDTNEQDWTGMTAALLIPISNGQHAWHGLDENFRACTLEKKASDAAHLCTAFVPHTRYAYIYLWAS